MLKVLHFPDRLTVEDASDLVWEAARVQRFADKAVEPGAACHINFADVNGIGHDGDALQGWVRFDIDEDVEPAAVGEYSAIDN